MKFNFIRKVITAIKDFDKYQQFAIEKKSVVIKYFLLLILMFSIVVSIGLTYKFASSIENGEDFYNEYTKLIEEYKMQEVESVQNISKEEIVSFINQFDIKAIYCMIFVIMIFYTFIIYLIVSLLDAIMLTLLGHITSRIIRLNLRIGITFKLSLYALTLPIILSMIYILINSFTGFTIKYFTWMYTTISYIYIITIILFLKSDLTKQRIEMIKIVSSEKKLEEESQEEPEGKKDDKKEEENKENPEKNKKGEMPEGSEA